MMKMMSHKARKQRKMRATAPLHLRHKMMASHLSDQLRSQVKRRSLPLRKGDEVTVMRGKFKGTTGKVAKIDLKDMKAYVDSVKRRKVSGVEVQIALDPSKLMITNPVLDDPRRKLVLERKR